MYNYNGIEFNIPDTNNKLIKYFMDEYKTSINETISTVRHYLDGLTEGQYVNLLIKYFENKVYNSNPWYSSIIYSYIKNPPTKIIVDKTEYTFHKERDKHHIIEQIKYICEYYIKNIISSNILNKYYNPGVDEYIDINDEKNNDIVYDEWKSSRAAKLLVNMDVSEFRKYVTGPIERTLYDYILPDVVDVLRNGYEIPDDIKVIY